MTDKIRKIIGDVINPATGQTLNSESRILNVEQKEETIKISYNREFISPANKEIIEANIKKTLTSGDGARKISFLTVNRSSDSKKPPSSVSAKLPGPKKRISGVKKIIGISSAKGGVGKSTVAVNIGFALKNLGKKVALVDADVYGPSLPLLLGQKSAKPMGNAEKKNHPHRGLWNTFYKFWSLRCRKRTCNMARANAGRSSQSVFIRCCMGGIGLYDN